MGLLAMIMAAGRWLELRLEPAEGSLKNAVRFSEGRIAGLVAILAMFLIGNIMMFYLEPLI
jgi:putative copper resistance protein D